MPLPDSSAFAEALAAGAGAKVSIDEADRVAYARDLWPKHLVTLRAGHAAGTRPRAIAWPTSTEQVSRLVAWCAREGVPIVPYGAGSGVCGGVSPDERTVVVDLKKMARWRQLDAHGPTLDVEAGAIGITLEEDLQRKGWTIGHFPSSILCSTVGGWVAARGAGQSSGKYGKIEDMLVDLELVDGTGEVSRVHRRVGALDLTPLVVGSEGTLGVVTSARLRLHRAPTAHGFAAFAFPSTEAGWEAMRAIFQRGLRPAVARLYDPFDAAIARAGSAGGGGAAHGPREMGLKASALRAILKLPRALNGAIELLEEHLPAGMFGSMLVLVFEESSADDAARGVEAVKALARELGGRDLGEGPARRWLTHRYAISYRQPPTIRAGAFLDTMEVAATWSNLRGLYHDVRHALGEHVFVMAHLSHAYPDGCSIYFTFAGTADSEAAATAKYERAWRDALDAAIAAGGTLSHHHGVGRSKAPKLPLELGVGIDVLRAVKRAWDPRGVLNLGNLFPPTGPRTPGSDTPQPATITLDGKSLLARAPASAKLAEVELAAHDLGASLRLAPALLDLTVGAWLDAGCPGAVDPFDDPVDHALAGLDARLGDGRVLSIRPTPRRAVGPDPTALIVGARGRFATPLSATLRVHRNGAPSVKSGATAIDRSAPITTGEQRLLDAIDAQLRA